MRKILYLYVTILLLASLAPAQIVQRAGLLQFQNISAPGGNPPPNSTYMYFDFTTGTFTCKDHTGANVCTSGGGSMIYPGAGVANSTGLGWAASYSVGTSANNLVQLNGSAQLPAVSGVLLTGIGTVTHTAGSLTNNAIVLGAGSADTKVLSSLGTTTTVLIGNASGLPSFGAVNLGNMVSGNLPVTNLNSGTNASSTTSWFGDGTWKTAGTVNTSGSPVSGEVAVLTGAATVTGYTGLTADSSGNVTSATLTTTGAGPDTYTEQAAPSTPSSGSLASWADSTDHRFHDKNSSSTVATTVVPLAASSSPYKPIASISTAGVITQTQVGFTDLSGTSGVFTTSTNVDSLDAGVFCADAGSTDDYACSLVPAITAGTLTGYQTGTHYRFKAATANTGAATLNLNSLGAKTLKKAVGGITTDLATNDVRAGQWVDVVYDGTNFQVQSVLGNGGSGGSGTVTNTGDCTTDCFSATGAGTTLTFRNATSGTLALKTVTGALGTVTLSLPDATDTLIAKATTDTLTNKTYDTAGSGNAFSINSQSITSVTGNTAKVATWTGATTASKCVDTDASGNLKVASADCGAGTVTSVSGTANQISVATGTSTPVLSIPSTFIAPGTITATTSIATGTAPASCGSASGIWCATEAATTGTPTAGDDYIRADTSHLYKVSLNNGSEFTSLMNYSSVDLASQVGATILPGANGGTGIAFAAFTGPASSLKTFTLPNASSTILTSNAAVTVAQGGTGLASGTNGGILGFTGTTTLASSGLLTANSPVLGGGSGATPKTIAGITTDGTSVLTLGVNATSTGGLVLANGGALGTSYTLNNTTGTTAITEHLPAIAASGVLATNNSSGTVTDIWSGDTNHIYTSGTQTTSVTVQTLCTTTNCPAGLYHIDAYVNELGTGCTTIGTGGVVTNLTFADGVSTKSAQPMGGFSTSGGVLTAGKMLFTTTGLGDGVYATTIRSDGTVTIQISTTVTACTTPGSWTGYQVKAVIYPVSAQ